MAKSTRRHAIAALSHLSLPCSCRLHPMRSLAWAVQAAGGFCVLGFRSRDKQRCVPGGMVMQNAGIQADEAARLAALSRYQILDTPPERGFDALTALLANILEVPIALISIVDRDRVWFKSRHGVAASASASDLSSFCGYVVAQNCPLTVADALADPRFSEHPLVVGEPRVRFYAGTPLRTGDGFALGTLCAVDYVPRQLTPAQLCALETLASQVAVLLELRRRNFELEERHEQARALQAQLQASLREKEALVAQLERSTVTLEQRVRERTLELARSEEDLSITVESLGDAVVATDREGRVVRMNRVAQKLLGWSAADAKGKPLDDMLKVTDELTGEATESLFARVLREQAIIGPTGRAVLHARNGSVCPIAETASPILGADGLLRGVVLVFRDVTSERATRNALRESEAKYRTVYDSLADMCATVDADQGDLLLDCNATLANILGFAKEELIGKTPQTTFAPASNEARELASSTFRRTGALHDLERELVRKDGRRIETSLSGTALRLEGGRTVALLVWRDISVRKQAERDRHFLTSLSDLQRHANVDALMDAATLSLAKYLDVQHATFSVLDETQEHIIIRAQPPFDMPSSGGWIKANAFGSKIVSQLRLGNTCVADDAMQDARIRDALPAYAMFGIGAFIAVPQLRNDRWVATLSVLTNAPRVWQEREVMLVQAAAERTFLWSEQLRLSAALRERELQTLRQKDEERFRTLVEGVKDYAIYLLDAQGHVASWNAGAQRIHGYDEKDILGRHISVFYPAAEQERGHPAEVLTHAARHGRYTEESFRMRRDGTPFWADVLVTALYAEDRSLVGFTKVTRDISERKRAEEILQQRQLQLSASLREREILLQEVHHRVKNNLQVISSLLRLQMRKLHEPAAREALAQCNARVEAIAMIHEMLYQVKDYTSIRFDEYARSLAVNIFGVVGVARSKVALELEIEPFSLDVDRAILCGLALNELIHNSLKHAFPAGRTGRVRVQLRKEERSILMAVGDDGVGLTATAHETQPEHVSLGMQLVQMLVAQLRGELKLECEHGSEFQVRFPALPDIQPAHFA